MRRKLSTAQVEAITASTEPAHRWGVHAMVTAALPSPSQTLISS